MIIKKVVKRLEAGGKAEAPSVEVWVDHTPLGRSMGQSALKAHESGGVQPDIGPRVVLRRKPVS